MYIPQGFAHGFVVLSKTADVIYKCTDYYNPTAEQGIYWNDPDIGIQWPIVDVIVSYKDRNNPDLSAKTKEQLPKYLDKNL
jgi:dTDP-4-dehydrorhamnose 3,5-epimerase